MLLFYHRLFSSANSAVPEIPREIQYGLLDNVRVQTLPHKNRSRTAPFLCGEGGIFAASPPLLRFPKFRRRGRLGISTAAPASPRSSCRRQRSAQLPPPLLTTCTLSRGVPSASLGTSPNAKGIIVVLGVDVKGFEKKDATAASQWEFPPGPPGTRCNGKNAGSRKSPGRQKGDWDGAPSEPSAWDYPAACFSLRHAVPKA